MFDCAQFRTYIIEPVLSKLQVYSKDAEELLVFTCAAESLGGTYLAQNKGPALGIYQMEPATYSDIWENFIRKNSKYAMLMSLNMGCSRIPAPDRLIYDLHYATAMARYHYMRVKKSLPCSSDVDSIWDFYKQYYNTPNGAADKSGAIERYTAFVQPR